MRLFFFNIIYHFYALVKSFFASAKFGAVAAFFIAMLQELEVFNLRDVIVGRLLYSKAFIVTAFTVITLSMLTKLWSQVKIYSIDTKSLCISFIDKVGISVITMIMFNSITTIEDWHVSDISVTILRLTGKITILVYVISEMMKDAYIISDGKFPPSFITKWFNSFNETGDPKIFVQGIKNAREDIQSADNKLNQIEENERNN